MQMLQGYSRMWHSVDTKLIYSRWDVDILFLIVLCVVIACAYWGRNRNQAVAIEAFLALRGVLSANFATFNESEALENEEMRISWAESNKMTFVSWDMYMFHASGRASCRLLTGAVLCCPRQCAWHYAFNRVTPNSLQHDALFLELEIEESMPLMNLAFIHQRRLHYVYSKQGDLRNFARKRSPKVLNASTKYVCVSDSQTALDAFLGKNDVSNVIRALFSEAKGSRDGEGKLDDSVGEKRQLDEMTRELEKFPRNVVQSLHISDLYGESGAEKRKCVIACEVLLTPQVLEARGKVLAALLVALLFFSDVVTKLNVPASAEQTISNNRKAHMDAVRKLARAEAAEEAAETPDPEKLRKQLSRQKKNQKKKILLNPTTGPTI